MSTDLSEIRLAMTNAAVETRNALLADSQPCRTPATQGGTAR